MTDAIPMARTVFILGAGASVEAGGPVMSNFVQKAEQIYRLRSAGKSQDSFSLVFRAREKLQRVFVKSSLDLNNIEELFAAFEMAGLLGRLADINESEVSQLALAMRRVITTTLEKEIKYPIHPNGNFAAPYTYQAFAWLLRLLHNSIYGPVSVISFNYDVALDYALTFADISFDYGLHAGPDPTAIKYLKLHGSLNWTRSQDDIIVQKLQRRPTDRVGDAPAQPLAVADLAAPGQIVSGLEDPVIVPPTWNKGQHHHDFRSLWRKAGQHLSTAENIVVIGYSAPLTDQFYRHLYALSTISDTMLERYLCIGHDVRVNHEKLMGGAGTARKVFSYTNEPFSRSFDWLGYHFPDVLEQRTLDGMKTIKTILTEVAGGRLSVSL